MHAATIWGHVEVVRLLAAVPNAASLLHFHLLDACGYMPVHLTALPIGYPEPATRERESRVKPTGEMLRVLAGAGFNLGVLNGEGLALVHMALRSRDYDLLTILLDLGADPNQRTNSGATPLHVAVETEIDGDTIYTTHAILKLLQHGAEPWATADGYSHLKFLGGTPRRWAEALDHYGAWDLLKAAEEQRP